MSHDFLKLIESNQPCQVIKYYQRRPRTCITNPEKRVFLPSQAQRRKMAQHHSTELVNGFPFVPSAEIDFFKIHCFTPPSKGSIPTDLLSDRFNGTRIAPLVRHFCNFEIEIFPSPNPYNKGCAFKLSKYQSRNLFQL